MKTIIQYSAFLLISFLAFNCSDNITNNTSEMNKNGNDNSLGFYIGPGIIVSQMFDYTPAGNNYPTMVIEHNLCSTGGNFNQAGYHDESFLTLSSTWYDEFGGRYDHRYFKLYYSLSWENAPHIAWGSKYFIIGESENILGCDPAIEGWAENVAFPELNTNTYYTARVYVNDFLNNE